MEFQINFSDCNRVIIVEIAVNWFFCLCCCGNFTLAFVTSDESLEFFGTRRKHVILGIASLGQVFNYYRKIQVFIIRDKMYYSRTGAQKVEEVKRVLSCCKICCLYFGFSNSPQKSKTFHSHIHFSKRKCTMTNIIKTNQILPPLLF